MTRRRAAVALAGLAGLATATVLVTTQLLPDAASPTPVVTTVAALPVEEAQDDRVPQGTLGVVAARSALRTLVRAAQPAPVPPYDRAAFGHSWTDPDRNGCDGRQDALAEWLAQPVARGSCVVSGELIDPYTGARVSVPQQVDIDHVVPLKEAWRSGASAWTPERRLVFANDLRHLIPSLNSANRQKADKSPEKWMPQRAYWCSYARVYVGTKSWYGLTVTAPEAQVLEAALNTCAGPQPS